MITATSVTSALMIHSRRCVCLCVYIYIHTVFMSACADIHEFNLFCFFFLPTVSLSKEVVPPWSQCPGQFFFLNKGVECVCSCVEGICFYVFYLSDLQLRVAFTASLSSFIYLFVSFFFIIFLQILLKY